MLGMPKDPRCLFRRFPYTSQNRSQAFNHLLQPEQSAEHRSPRRGRDYLLLLVQSERVSSRADSCLPHEGCYQRSELVGWWGGDRVRVKRLEIVHQHSSEGLKGVLVRVSPCPFIRS